MTSNFCVEAMVEIASCVPGGMKASNQGQLLLYAQRSFGIAYINL
jgi:hypothetical protein